jgi:hypothetical protein
MDLHTLRCRGGWLGFKLSSLGCRPVADSCEHDNETSGSIQGWDFLWKQNKHDL